MTRKLKVTFLSLIAISINFIFIPQAHASRISYTSSNSSAISRGQSVTFTISLDEPIICPSLDGTCLVLLNFSNNNDAATSLNTNSITWLWNEWNQTRQIVLTVRNNITHLNTATVSLTSTAVSESEYYRNFGVTITQNITLPLSPTQEAAEELRLRKIEIANYREVLLSKLRRSERPLLLDYQNAAFPKVVIRTYNQVTNLLLDLSVTDRVKIENIEKIAESTKFLDDFYSKDIRPSVQTYQDYNFVNINNNILQTVNKNILGISDKLQFDKNIIQSIIDRESFVYFVSKLNPTTFPSVLDFTKMGLIDRSAPYKTSVISGLMSLKSTDLDTFDEIKYAIDLGIANWSARKVRNLTIISKISSRKTPNY